jgi:hypothetical protein
MLATTGQAFRRSRPSDTGSKLPVACMQDLLLTFNRACNSGFGTYMEVLDVFLRDPFVQCSEIVVNLSKLVAHQVLIRFSCLVVYFSPVCVYVYVCGRMCVCVYVCV